MSRIPVHLVISGSHEAVAEVVMAMRQSLSVRVNRSEYGASRAVVQCYGIGTSLGTMSFQPFGESPIQEEDSAQAIADGKELLLHGIEDLPAYSRFTASFLLDPRAIDTMAAALARAHPDVAVGVVSDQHPYEVLTGQVRSNGAKFQFRVPPWPGSQAARGCLPESHLKLLEERVLPELARMRSKRPASAHGWPRWSLLAHAANSVGVTGLAQAVAAAAPADVTQALLDENRAARAIGVASWVDTLMFGDSTPHAPDAPRPYTHCDVLSWLPRQEDLLAFLHANLAPQTEHHAFATALLQALADPDTRLQHGLHPIAFLPVAAAADWPASGQAPQARDLTPALRAVFEAFPERARSVVVTDAKLHASAITAALACEGRHGSARAALRAGFDSATVLRSLDAIEQGETALDGLREVFGSYRAFSKPLRDEIHLLGGAVEAAYQALVTHEAMQERLGAAAGQAPPSGRNRRRSSI